MASTGSSTPLPCGVMRAITRRTGRYDDAMSTSPSGQSIHLSRTDGDRTVTAHIASVGAALRGLTVAGSEVVPSYPADIPAPSASGIVLFPWPNRIRDGRWTDGDEERQLAITEPDKNNAIHGFLRYVSWEVDAPTDDASTVTLRANVFPQTGYPHLLATSVTYTLTADGVDVEHRAENVGATPAPIALGTHPFLTIGGAAVSDLSFRSDVTRVIDVDDRLLPTGYRDVSADEDLSGGRPLADLQLDTGFGAPRRDADGRARHTLSAADGRSVTLWQDESFDWLQLYTSTSYPGHDKVIAVEPMTAPADAFNSGLGVRMLAPGESSVSRWGIAASI